jgi:hypothetical protein
MPTTVCWFVQSHRDPGQILRLLRLLRRSSDGPILWRHDETALALDPAPFAAIAGVHPLPAAGPQIRGTFSCGLQPYLDALDWLEDRRVAYDWLINLSAQDYPVQPVDRIEAYLESTTADGFLRWWDVSSPESPWSQRKARARYGHRFWQLSPRTQPLLAALRWMTRLTPLHFYLDYGPLVGVRRLRTPYGEGLRCMGGRSWWTLRRPVVRYLREFLDARPDVERHYRESVAPEESMVQTILAENGRFQLVNDDLRYIDYAGAVRGSPRTLTPADFPLLASGSYQFARKFDWATGRALLDRIDTELLGIPPG